VIVVTDHCKGLPTAQVDKGISPAGGDGRPHCITLTHIEEVNVELVNFLGVAKRAASIREGSSRVIVSFQPLRTGVPSETGTLNFLCSTRILFWPKFKLFLAFC
jgi:hypothetical protein